jgi:hypothetical protein
VGTTILVAEAAPREGVVNDGEVPNTKAPEPVSSEIADAKFELVGVAKKLETPLASPDTPVDIGSPVAFVKVAELGVPNAGVVKVGLVSVLFVNVSAPVSVASVPVLGNVIFVALVDTKLVEYAPEVESVDPSANDNVAFVTGVVIATLLILVAEAAPREGVVNDGEVPNTKAPEPVSPVTADARFALVGVPKKVATSVPKADNPVPPFATGSIPVTPVVRGSAVALVKVAELGVPNAGVIKDGLVFKTTLPVPVAVVVPVPPFTTETTLVVLLII